MPYEEHKSCVACKVWVKYRIKALDSLATEHKALWEEHALYKKIIRTHTELLSEIERTYYARSKPQDELKAANIVIKNALEGLRLQGDLPTRVSCRFKEAEDRLELAVEMERACPHVKS